MRNPHAFRSVRSGVGTALSVPAIRSLLALTVSLIAGAAIFYSWVEGWPLLDSVYFASVTIATVGYGDFAPQTAAGKIFTIAYIFTGIGIFVAAASALAQHIIREAGDR